MTLAGGTFASGGFSEGANNAAVLGVLTLTAADSFLDFGTGTVGVLSFTNLMANSNLLDDQQLDWHPRYAGHRRDDGSVDFRCYAGSQPRLLQLHRL